MNKRTIISISLVALLSGFLGCTEAQESAGKVLDSAGSIIRTGKEKAWVDPDVTPTPEPQS